MANQMYGGGGGGYNYGVSLRPGATDPYVPSDQSSLRYSSSSSSAALDPYSKYSSSSPFGGYGGTTSTRYPHTLTTSTATTTSTNTHPPSWHDSISAAATAGIKRQSEALYHQNYLGNQNTIGQSEGLFPTNTLAKRSRLETATNLPVYPQRPGEKDCAHYMLTRTCRFGESCKFDHPIWVPEGGLPDWKEVPLVPLIESLPERPAEPDCPYFLKTQKCKFGVKCKFNHPKNNMDSSIAVNTVSVSVLPERSAEPPCAFYMKTGKCKFGVNCKFNHPKDIQVSLSDQENGTQTESAVRDVGTVAAVKQLHPFTIPALVHNSKGLPVRPGEADCPFYIRTGSCKYGALCRYNHPDRNVMNPQVAAGLSGAVMSSPATNLNFGVINPAASILPAIDPRLAQTTLGVGPTVYPQRPGEIECDFYMKTGVCKFGDRCRFNHPVDRYAPAPSMANQALQQNVKLTLAGLPRREGQIICPFYLKTATCKYGVNCRFDHPPPGEAIAMATVQGTSVGVEGEGNGTDTTQEQQQ